MDPKLFEPLIQLLKDKPIEIYRERKNSGVGRSLPFGILNRRNYGLGHSRNNTRYTEHYKELLKLSEIIPMTFKYTTIMLNDNYKTLPHKDKNNDGISLIVGFGDYEGGNIDIEGKEYDIRYKPLEMDAETMLHSTMPWTGSRYSIVFFRIKLQKSVKDKYNGWTFKELNDALGVYSGPSSEHKLT
jgi:hypothetical protein